MKGLVVLLYVAINLIACDMGSVNVTQKPENWVADANATPNSNGCEETDYRPKPEADIANMSPHQLIDEMVKTELYRDSFESLRAWADYQQMIDKYIRKSGVKTLPTLTDYVNSYDPKNASACDKARIMASAIVSNDLDRFEFRIRAISEGQAFMKALEQAVGRMKEIGFDNREKDYQNNRRFRIYEGYLEDMKGLNEADSIVKETFIVRYKIEISDDELRRFSNFLISRDPKYPSWSETDYIEDYSRVSPGNLPLKVYVFKKPERFYKAYEEFKKSKDTNRLNK